jgi:hypothetical protein
VLNRAVGLAELASAGGWDEAERRDRVWRDDWEIADFGERGFAIFLPVDLSSSVEDVLVRRSTGRYPAGLAESAQEVIERGPWLAPEPRAFEQLALRPLFHMRGRP